MSDTQAPKCPGCGHNYYDDAPVKNGYCKWCVEEGVYSLETQEANDEKWRRHHAAVEAKQRQEEEDEANGFSDRLE